MELPSRPLLLSAARLTRLWLVLPALFGAGRGSQAGDAASIRGQIDQKSSLVSAAAVNRSNGKRFPGKVESDSGNFRVGGLPLGGTYDLILDLRGGRLEGVNMRVPRSDYLEEQPLSDDDIAVIAEKVRSLNKFEDVVEILAIDGNIQHAAVLVNKLRTKPFYESKPGEIIWRPELWHFERPEETWVKVQDELFVILYRDRLAKAEFDKRSVTFDSRLGGLQVTAGEPELDVGVIAAPEPAPGVRYRGAGARPQRVSNRRDSATDK